MAKWYGNIGFAENTELEPGLWIETMIDRPYYGDVIRNFRKLENSQAINNDININNQISIVSDPYANQHFFNIRYVEFQGAKWKVNNVEVQYPRLILDLGGLWNENKT